MSLFHYVCILRGTGLSLGDAVGTARQSISLDFLYRFLLGPVQVELRKADSQKKK